MWNALLLSLVVLCSLPAAAGSALTDTETRWLNAGWPVLSYAKQHQLPIDVVVQPQPSPGAAPLAMGFVDGRCKLVLSMRGNPEAETTLAKIEPALLNAVVEAMTAHELGHCWRYVHGAWHTLPAGFADITEDPDADPQRVALRRDMRETRREEGFADLVGLAWTLSRHAQQYGQVHAWLARFRDDQPVPGSHHDTRAWIRLAKDGQAFPAGDNPFERAWPVWQQGLLSDD
ncbi:hypothetical protein [Piscinibacter sp.]|jgi:hypothetical protein|uniref:hypothetical protein n=1 Tax=Piscinibacter sp. TaxID=1903157 RepID=UPI002F423306